MYISSQQQTFIYTHYFFFFFNDTATTEIYTLSLHDALPISALDGAADLVVGRSRTLAVGVRLLTFFAGRLALLLHHLDRKSTRLNSSHSQISYAVFCLKKKTIVLLVSGGHTIILALLSKKWM